MRKLFVHLSLLCLLVALAVPMVGCSKEEAEVEESTTSAMEEPMATTDTMGTDMGMDMGTDMGGTMDPMGTEMTPPPAQ